ncbi:hypothetical protein [Streptomyces sp. enrichment culture]|uniref:hypothetical protein n=1 Tax=Streptomyces sp. enrichment culture TaxID=1795815 RepID=UPI003F56B2C9
MSRLWRRIVLCWVVLVAVAGGLTLWLQDSVQPPPQTRWEESRTPAPLPTDLSCPPSEADYVVCAYATLHVSP